MLYSALSVFFHKDGDIYYKIHDIDTMLIAEKYFILHVACS